MPAHPHIATDSSNVGGHAVNRVDAFGVDLYGQFDLVTGLGESSRGYARALQLLDVPVHLIPLGSMYPGLTTVDSGLTSDPRRFPLAIEHVNADTTDRFLRRFGGALAGTRARVAVWYWELAALRPDWVQNALQYDEIWVASAYGQRAVSAVTNVPVVVVPPPVTLSRGAGGAPSREACGNIPSDAFVFLYVFDYSSYVDRKNPSCLVDAFVDEFGAEPDVRLVLKVSHADPRSVGFQRLCETATTHPNITLIHEVFDDAALHALFTRADCYVSPHRSEGFGLTVAEAMLRECPVIATDYGSTTDFVTPETGFPLEYMLVEIAEDQGPYQRGYVWADPSREHLRILMRRVVDDAAGTRRRAEAGRRFIEERYSLRAVGERMVGRLRRLHDESADA